MLSGLYNRSQLLIIFPSDNLSINNNRYLNACIQYISAAYLPNPIISHFEADV